ncbi:MAG: amidohydrolase family protein [Candidatus Moraniibacteriota bacterium]
MKFDAHVHISIYEKNVASLEKSFSLLLQDMEQNGVSAAIVIPDNIEGSDTIADLDRAIGLIGERKNIFLLGSPQIVQRGSGEIERYRILLETGTIRGLKFFPGHDPYYPTDERCLPYYDLCERLDVPVLFHTGGNSGDEGVARWNDPKYIVEIAKRYPRLKVIITHFFWPRMEYCYEMTKDVPNIWFEIAAMADSEVIEESGGITAVRDVLRKTIFDRPDKVLFGSDCPMCGIRDHIGLIASLGLPKDIEEAVYFRNAMTVYRIPEEGIGTNTVIL